MHTTYCTTCLSVSGRAQNVTEQKANCHQSKLLLLEVTWPQQVKANSGDLKPKSLMIGKTTGMVMKKN